MSKKDKEKKNKPQTAPQAETPAAAAPVAAPTEAAAAPASNAVSDKIGAVAETLKNNKGLAALLLKKSPLGLLAGAVLSTKEGQQLADKVIDKAAEAAGSAFKSASTLAQKAEGVIRDTAAEKIADVIRGPKKDDDKGPKGP